LDVLYVRPVGNLSHSAQPIVCAPTSAGKLTVSIAGRVEAMRGADILRLMSECRRALTDMLA
jgi:hypothetical protein